jgi:glycosyltransferase involved in cell wall biosynthesis
VKTLLHFAQDDDTSGFFPQLALWHDRSRYHMHFAALRPMADWLRAYMQERGVPTFSCGCRSRLTYPLGLLRLARYLRQVDVQILHAHLFDPAVVGLSAATVARTPLRVLTRHHSDYHTRIAKRWHVGLDQLCTRLSHAVIGVSQHTAAHLIEAEHAPAEKVSVVHNGIDFERVRVSAPGAPEKLRRELAPHGERLLLIAARLHPEKGYEHLFAALPVVRERISRPIRLLVAGQGPLLNHYRKMAEALGCSDMVQFLGFRRDITDLMAAADVFVLPSVAEAFGLVLAEAIYLGTPVVATRVGGIPEIVDDGVDGILVPPGDGVALADALVHLLADDGLRCRLAGAGRERVRAQFRFEEMVRAYEALYERAWAGRGGARCLKCP